MALDVSRCVRELSSEKTANLAEWIDSVSERSVELFGKKLRVGLSPKDKIIGRQVCEMAFLYDPDGSVVEVLNFVSVLEQEVESGWNPWDGKGFKQQEEEEMS